jgi:PhnB protein
MMGVEIDFVVSDCLAALEVYKKIFGIEPIEVTNLPKGQNEVVFTIYGTSFHMLDENTEFGLRAPDPQISHSIWFNIIVPDIHKVFKNAIDSGCKEIQAITEIEGYGVSNAIFKDSFGYVWMLHQIHSPS